MRAVRPGYPGVRRCPIGWFEERGLSQPAHLNQDGELPRSILACHHGGCPGGDGDIGRLLNAPR